jgi:hypothetical protein
MHTAKRILTRDRAGLIQSRSPNPLAQDGDHVRALDGVSAPEHAKYPQRPDYRDSNSAGQPLARTLALETKPSSSSPLYALSKYGRKCPWPLVALRRIPVIALPFSNAFGRWLDPTFSREERPRAFARTHERCARFLNACLSNA